MKINCPYCGYKNDVDEPYDYIDGGEYQCSECEKNFWLIVEYDPFAHAYKADCLNGEPHNFRLIHGAPRKYFINKIRCKDCSHEEENPEIFVELAKKDEFWNNYLEEMEE